MTDNDVNTILRSMPSLSNNERETVESILTNANMIDNPNNTRAAENVSTIDDTQNTDTVASDIDALANTSDINTVTTSTSENTESNNTHIQENSKSILMDMTTSRFSSAIWFNKVKENSILLAGIGGIGSYVGFLLSRLKVERLSIYDPDVVDEVNLSGQLYSVEDIGSYKVDALTKTVRNYSNFNNVMCYTRPYTSEEQTKNIMICGFDNMTAREVFFYKWLGRVMEKPASVRNTCLFIDGRLAAEELQIFCFTGDNTFAIDKYKKEYLFSDSEAEKTVCSYKQTSFMSNMIGSLIVNLYVNFCANQCNPLVERDLPFFTSYSADTMYFKVIE